jgi:hypothetical protein
MKTALGLLMVILMAQPAICAQFASGHKSEEQIAQMTTDQRVEEFCKERARRLFLFHDEYEDMLKGYLFKDGLKVVPQVIREIEAYDPTDEELSAFVNYLIEKDPYYPSWSKVKSDQLVNPEPCHQAYLEYKPKK